MMTRPYTEAVFNLQGSEIVFILLIALVVLGPEKLPGAIRKATQTYTELRKMSTGFQSEFRSALDEPMREMRQTADLLRESADPTATIRDAQRAAPPSMAAERAAEHDLDDAAREAADRHDPGMKPVSAVMGDAAPATTVGADAAGPDHQPDDQPDDEPVDAFADPIDPVEPETEHQPEAPARPVLRGVDDPDDDARWEERSA